MATSACISGDIIAFTSLNSNEKSKVESELSKLLNILDDKFDVYGRVIKGDYLECYIPNPGNALRIALCFKSLIKSLDFGGKHTDKRRHEKFKQYGIRIAIGIGEISRFDKSKGIIDGEAIYNSGRLINNTKATYNSERIVIKNTLFIKSPNEKFDANLEPMLELIDVLIRKATPKQSQILYYKLIGYSEAEIETILPIAQSTINTHSKSLGWNAIEKAINWFEHNVNK